MKSGFFTDFTVTLVNTPYGKIRVRTGGAGFPLLLLHGHPRTHTTWYQVAPVLAQTFTVVCADLPGFGQSYQPATVEDSSGRAKAMDFPTNVAGLVVMDGVPIYEALERADWRFARDWWHWFFFAQSDKAEAAIRADPELWYPLHAVLGEENAADYLEATRNPEVVRGRQEGGPPASVPARPALVCA